MVRVQGFRRVFVPPVLFSATCLEPRCSLRGSSFYSTAWYDQRNPQRRRSRSQLIGVQVGRAEALAFRSRPILRPRIRGAPLGERALVISQLVRRGPSARMFAQTQASWAAG
jgi:hypothetical protein